MKNNRFIFLLLSLFFITPLYSQEEGCELVSVVGLRSSSSLENMHRFSDPGVSTDLPFITEGEEENDSFWDELSQGPPEEEKKQFSCEYTIPEYVLGLAGTEIDPQINTLRDIATRPHYGLKRQDIGKILAIRCSKWDRTLHFKRAVLADIITKTHIFTDQAILVMGVDKYNKLIKKQLPVNGATGLIWRIIHS